MSQASDQAAPASTKSPEVSWWRALRFPLIVLIVFACVFAIPWVLAPFDLEFEGSLQLSMFTQWMAPILTALVLAVWWVFFAHFRLLTRLSVVALVVLAGAGFKLSLREMELTMGQVTLVPRLHFIWEPTANEKVANYIAQDSGKGDELPEAYAYISDKDYPRYRGPNVDGVVPWANLETDWDKTPPTVVWSHPSAGGYSGVAIAGNLAVTLEQREDGESVVCYDRATGRQRWALKFSGSYIDATQMGNGPRSTPTIHSDEHIYAIGATGAIVCLDCNGKLIWTRDTLKDARAKNIKWGMTGSPLIVHDLVIANPGIDEDAAQPENSSLIAYEKASGKIRWRAGNRPAGYSSPQLATIAGTPQIVLFDGAGLAGYDPKTGAELWQFPWVTDFNMNSMQPVILGDRIFISSEQKNGCAMLQIKSPAKDDKAPWQVEVAWRNKNLAARYANPVTDGKSIFGLHNPAGVLTCLDAATGQLKWRADREGPGQLLLAANALILTNGESGDVKLFAIDASECKPLAKFQTFDKRDKTWNTPSLAADQLFVRNQEHITCLKLPMLPR